MEPSALSKASNQETLVARSEAPSLLDAGLSCVEIAGRLGISPQAVSHHVRRLGRSLKVGWDGEEIATLRRAWDEGLTARKTAALLPNRAKNAVVGKASRLGLAPRPSPIRR